jgi:signal transduction histidine kinase
MPPAERARRALARTDVRAAVTIAGVLMLTLGVQGLALYAYVASEYVEEAERWLYYATGEVQTSIAAGVPLERAVRERLAGVPGGDIAVRLRDPSGALIESWGRWPEETRQLAARGRSEHHHFIGRLASHKDVLVGGSELAGGNRIELALPLRHFVHETGEVGRRLLLAGLLSGALALAVGLWASLRAFAPLRRATALLRDLDARSLGRRLPTRSTGDPVDRHAETLNEVLTAIDTAFGRLRAFSSDVAHELRTPLNRIGNVVDVALLSGDERELRSALETIRDSTHEMARMTQSLLLLAEIDDRRLSLRRETIDVESWFAKVGEVYAPSFEERGAKLAQHAEPLRIEGDRTLLDRILVNLLDNALARVEAGGRVELGAERSAGGVAIRVDDSGPGVPPAERERIFDRFARLADSQRVGGHGLGLAIARGVARLHGGDLRVGDSPLGGARFELWLPGKSAD